MKVTDDMKTEIADAIAPVIFSGERKVRASELSDAIKSTGVMARVFILKNGDWELADEDAIIDWRFGFAKVELG